MKKRALVIVFFCLFIKLAFGSCHNVFPDDYFDKLDNFPNNEIDLFRLPQKDIDADTVAKYLLQCQNTVSKIISEGEVRKYKTLGFYEKEDLGIKYLFFLDESWDYDSYIYLCAWSNDRKDIYPPLLILFHTQGELVDRYFRTQRTRDLPEVIVISSIIDQCNQPVGIRSEWFLLFEPFICNGISEMNISESKTDKVTDIEDCDSQLYFDY